MSFLRLIALAPVGLVAIIAVSFLIGCAVALLERPCRSQYVTSPLLGSTLDFWDAPTDECHGADVAYQQVMIARMMGRKPDVSFVDRLPGHHTIAGGMRVRLLEVSSIVCAGTVERFAHVQVDDPRSPLLGHAGYVTDARITQLTEAESTTRWCARSL
jgi:hypothetical protein